jgi:thiazole/oxazole-forming peptide maturase SagD family component
MTPAETLARLLAIEGMEPPQPTPLFTDEPKLAVYTARFGARTWGQGAHTDPTIAQLKAAAEALERRCLLTPDGENSVVARYGDLQNQIDPADFFCYSVAQAPGRAAAVDALRAAPLHWTSVRDSATGEKALAPREFVYLDGANLEQTRIRRESNSSGAAIGLAGAGEAFPRGLYELIERDAFMTAWLNNCSLPRIGGLTGEAAALAWLLDRYRLDCRVFDLRGHLGVPAVLVLTLDSSGLGPAVTAGLGSAESYELAIPAAILESISYRRQFRLKQMSGEIPETTDRSDVASVETRIAYWSHLERLADLPAWAASDPARGMAELGRVRCPPAQALRNLSNSGHRVLEADITQPPAAAAGFEALRVIVPQLHPLFLSESAKALQNARLGAIDADLNSLPHPFA